jgi:3-deoxy-D-manno-octulosonic acid (KDO) 8-phosphate synthase
LSYNQLKEKFFVIAGPNVIESEEHVLFMAKQLKEKKALTIKTPRLLKTMELIKLKKPFIRKKLSILT